MASSSSSPSYLNTACGLLSFLDLNEKRSENMEDMETERVVDVPDTPDRLAARQITNRQCIQNGDNSSLSSHLRSSDFIMGRRVNGMRGVGMLFNENGDDLVCVNSSKNIPSNDLNKNPIVLSPKENSHVSQNNLLFGRARMEKRSFQGMKPFIGPRHMDNGINISVDSSSKQRPCYENATVPQIIEHDPTLKDQMVYQHVIARDRKTENTLKEHSAHFMLDARKKPNIKLKGKEKVVDDSSQDLGLSVIHRKGVEKSNDTNDRHEKQVLNPVHSLISPRTSGQKRLVRNGCISPHNIAIRTKNLAEQHVKSSRLVDRSDSGNIASSSPSCLIDIKDIVAEENHRNKEKGKGIILQPSISQDVDVRDVCASSSTSDTGKAIEANPVGSSKLDTSECSEEVGGWRRTHNYSRKAVHLCDPSGSSKKFHNVGRCAKGKIGSEMARQVTSGQEYQFESDHAGNSNTAQRASSMLSKMSQTTGLCQTESKFNKRPKKRGSTSHNNMSCHASDVMYIGSSGEPSNSRSTRLRSHINHDNLNEVIMIDELSPEMRHPVSQAVDCPNDDHSDARAMQVEADEMLARELQEQLYQEMPVGGVEIDEYIAMALQHVEDGLHTSSSSGRSHSRGSLIAQGSRRPRSQTSQTSSNRRETQARVNRSSRLTRLRNQLLGDSHRVSSRQRNINFPMHMDLDMRLDILEALEARVGDMGDVRMSRNIFHTHRDFDENDYELLLSLDEHNHRHAGTSTNRINSLPQSTVQTDSIEEACAICLENPTIGDVIRHLPCLHKFHKDCIDPWLQRKTSCPVCKSSIT